MRRLTFILLVCAALLACGAAFAEPGEAEVMVSNGHLSVTAQNAAIGNILSAISQQAGFELDINPAVSVKTVTTKFKDLDIQKGIERLLALVRQKDYFIYYKPDGGIKKLEVHAPSETSSPAPQNRRPSSPFDYRRNNRSMPQRPQIRHTPQMPNGTNTSPAVTPFPGRSTSVPRTPVTMPPMPVNPQPATPHSNYHRSAPVSPVKKVPTKVVPPASTQPDDTDATPYIPPARMPAYIPPKH